MKKFRRSIFITLLVLSFTNSYSQPHCRDDIIIQLGDKGGEWPGFQAVQSVWLDDTTHNSPNDLISIDNGGYLLMDCTSLKMIVDKPTLLFGVENVSGVQRDHIWLRVQNYFTVAKTFCVRFTIIEENNRIIWQSQKYTVPAGVSVGNCVFHREFATNISTPLPGNGSNYFKFQSPGIKHIKMELVDGNGNKIQDADTKNQTVLLKCEAITAKHIPFTAIPFLFEDRLVDYQPSADFFGIMSPWFDEIKREMEFFYSMLPLPEHDISTEVICAGYAQQFTSARTLVNWVTLDSLHKNAYNDKDVHKLLNLDFGYGKKIAFVDYHSGFGYLADWKNASGLSYGFEVNSYIGQLPTINAIFVDWVNGGGGTMHMKSHM